MQFITLLCCSPADCCCFLYAALIVVSLFPKSNFETIVGNDTKTVDYSKHERFTLNEDFTIQYSSGKDPTEFTKISNISKLMTQYL